MPELSPVNQIAVVVDRALCIGSGDCVDTAPDVFQLDDEDNLTILQPHPAAGLADQVRHAVRSCPKAALTLDE